MSESDILQWSEFGLAGLVIGVLFAALFIIVKWLIAHIDKQAERHKDERAEWRQSSDEVASRVEKSVDEISRGIRELVDKITN